MRELSHNCFASFKNPSMTLDRRINNGLKASKVANTAASSQFASVQERRVMKKVARPEHAYTGCVPYSSEDEDSDVLPKKRNPPILGYRGHLRRDEDRIGTTFTQGLAVASRPAEPTLPKSRPSNNQPRQVRFVEDKALQSKPLDVVKRGMSPRSGYGQFDNASGYGAFAAPPNADMPPSSGYGEFDDASGYGAFAAPPPRNGMSPRSGYGEFANASGYGAFAAPPAMSSRSGYGAFDNASGYGAFAAPPGRGEMSQRSGYGAFDNANGYGAFAAPPGGMSLRSGYGAFDNASGYGAFAAPPAQKGMSPRSGYGEFDNTSDYGAFAAPPGGGMSPRKFNDARGYNNFASPRDRVQTASKPDPDYTRGYEPRSTKSTLHRETNYTPLNGQNGTRVHLSDNQTQELRGQHRDDKRASTSKSRTPSDSVRQAKYQQAVYRVGGEQAALRLWISAGETIWQRYISRTELLQAVKRSFEKHERTNHGFMTKAQLKEALRDLGCVFTDDQITALFGMYDKLCSGTVPMSELLLALTENI